MIVSKDRAFSNHNEMKRIKFRINNRNMYEKCINAWKLNTTILNDQWVKAYFTKN